MTERVTKRERFAELREAVADNDELVAFIDHEIELLNKKRGTKTRTKAQVENDATKAAMVEALTESGEAMRATDLGAEVGIGVQKATALLKQLVEDGAVVREVDKKVVTFKVTE